MKIKVTIWHECIKKRSLEYLVKDLKGKVIRVTDRFDYSMYKNRDGRCFKIKLLLF